MCSVKKINNTHLTVIYRMVSSGYCSLSPWINVLVSNHKELCQYFHLSTQSFDGVGQYLMNFPNSPYPKTPTYKTNSGIFPKHHKYSSPGHLLRYSFDSLNKFFRLRSQCLNRCSNCLLFCFF